MSTFTLGLKSKQKLLGVDEQLKSCVARAIELSSQDFTVFEGVRTLQRQRELVAKGASKTLRSKHIPDAMGVGRAVDLVPWVGEARWEWGLIYPIAAAMCEAAKEQGLEELHWGGVWDRPLMSFDASAAGMKMAVLAYQQRHPGPDFIDGPHFQLGS